MHAFEEDDWTALAPLASRPPARPPSACNVLQELLVPGVAAQVHDGVARLEALERSILAERAGVRAPLQDEFAAARSVIA